MIRSKALLFIPIFLMTSNAVLSQNIPEIVATLQIDTILRSGPKDNRINFAFANVKHESAQSYSSKSSFIFDIQAIERRFRPGSTNAKQGFSQYRNFFNLYSIWFPEPITYDPKPAYYQLTQGIRDQLFLPWADDRHGWITMMYTLRGGGGGGAGLERNRRVGDALIWGLDLTTVLHEFNHTLPGLSDEYTASGSFTNYQCNESPNTTGALLASEVPWRKWLAEDIPIPTPYKAENFGKIGAFEGNISGYFGCYRPSGRECYMGAGGFGEGYGEDMCSVCLQRFICMLYQYVDVIEHKFPTEQQLIIDGPETLQFSASVVKPEPNTQRYEWFLNGERIAKGVESVNVSFGECDRYELTFVVTDTTDFVRYDEQFGHIYPEPKQSYTWYIDQSQVTDYDLQTEITSLPVDCTGDPTGSIQLSISGGKAPYRYLLNGQSVSPPIDQLAAGNYHLNVLDANGCRVEKQVQISADPLVDFKLASIYQEGGWELYPDYLGEPPVGVSLAWSDGSTAETLEVQEAGTYSLQITTPEGCALTRSVDLKSPPSPLEVRYEWSNTLHDQSSGAIYLSIMGGLPPYQIQWFTGKGSDLTVNSPAQVISSGNGEIARHLPEFAFDDIVTFEVDFWAENFTGTNYIGYDFGDAQAVDFYAITSNVDVPARDAKSWSFQGSNDGRSWTTLHTVNDFTFPDRLEKKEFFLDASAQYRYYRIWVTANWGDHWVAIQEIEIGRRTFSGMELVRNQPGIHPLAAGVYQFIVTDANHSLVSEVVNVRRIAAPETPPIQVEQDGFYRVKIKASASGFRYYWFADKECTELLHTGNSFTPPAAGNYFVKAQRLNQQVFGSEIKGFAVSMPEVPIVNTTESALMIQDPEPASTYVWYDQEQGGLPVHIGNNFTPAETGTYYVSRRPAPPATTALQPNDIPGIRLWMDAADLDGDGQIDLGRPSSSAYQWSFRQGGKWRADNWFPFRSNYQNGLGVVDFATLWFQYIDVTPGSFQTIVLAYEENDLSFPGSAPIYGLVENIPRHQDASQLFSDNAPARVLNGRVYLNGERVNPLKTANPLKFSLLSVVMTEFSDATIYATHEYWEGKIGELLIWDRPLSEQEMDGVHEYLRQKWISTADLESPRSPVEWNTVTSTTQLAGTTFKVFPNPSSSHISLQVDEPVRWLVQLTDLSGKVLLNTQLQQTTVTISLLNLQSGLYSLVLTDPKSGKRAYHKVVKVE